MSRTIQVTFDARDPRAQSRFWAQALGYTIPGPPGVDVPEGSDPLQAWGDFLTRLGASCLSARDEPPRDLAGRHTGS